MQRDGGCHLQLSDAGSWAGRWGACWASLPRTTRPRQSGGARARDAFSRCQGGARRDFLHLPNGPPAGEQLGCLIKNRRLQVPDHPLDFRLAAFGHPHLPIDSSSSRTYDSSSGRLGRFARYGNWAHNSSLVLKRIGHTRTGPRPLPGYPAAPMPAVRLDGPIRQTACLPAAIPLP